MQSNHATTQDSAPHSPSTGTPTPEQLGTSAVAHVLKLADSILQAHRTGNNGAIMGEARLCDYFANGLERLLPEARQQLAFLEAVRAKAEIAEEKENIVAAI